MQSPLLSVSLNRMLACCSGDKLMAFAILHSCFDESGKFHDHDVIAFCGWIALLQDWEKLAVSWRAALERHRLPDIHMIRVHRDKALRPILSEFTSIIRENVICGVGVGFDAKHYRSMKPKTQKKIGDPQAFAFATALEMSVDRLDALAKHYGIPDTEISMGLICDQDESLAIHPKIRAKVTGICFADSQKYHPLQAADIIAYETREELERRRKHPEMPACEIFRQLLSKSGSGSPDGFFEAKLYDAATLDRIESGEGTL